MLHYALAAATGPENPARALGLRVERVSRRVRRSIAPVRTREQGLKMCVLVHALSTFAAPRSLSETCTAEETRFARDSSRF